MSIHKQKECSAYSLAFIGIGRVGSLLAELFSKHYPIAGFYDREPAKVSNLQNRIQCGKAFTDISLLLRDSNLIFITTPDDQIESVVQQVIAANVPLTGKYFVHTSGLHPSSILQRLQGQATAILSCHPCVSIVQQKALDDVVFMLEGDAAGIEVGKELVQCLGGHVMLISPDSKTIYHLGAVLTANFLISILYEVSKLYENIGLTEKQTGQLMVPLLKSTVTNVENLGLKASLTGPAARGDRTTISQHLDLLPSLDSDFANLTLLLYKRALLMAIEQKYIAQDTGQNLLDVITKMAHRLENK